jgi:hypothetical protein
LTFSDDTKSPIVMVGRRIILAMGGEILVAHDKAGVQFLRQTRAAGSVVQATREPDLCDGYHRPLMAQQLAFHRKLKCAHCWGKRHGEYHNDHSHYAYGGSCCCRYRLRRVGTLTSTEHGGKRRSVTGVCHTNMPTTCYRGTVVGTTLCTLPITSSLAV